MEKIKLKETDYVFIRDGNRGGIGCGIVNNDGYLYLIDETKQEAYRLPEKYKDTPLIIYHPCGGYQDGLIMVSTLGEIDLQYHHDFYDTAGMWGWIDLEGNKVIPPQYVYAMSFIDGRAIVCKGDWSVDGKGRYWCENEQWGIIDRTGKEIAPCRFDEVYCVEDTDRYLFCHEGGWENGYYCIYDMDAGDILVKLDFDFLNGYMFNSCFFRNGCICFDDHLPGEGVDLISIYSPAEHKWIAYREEYKERKFKGESKWIVNKDGEDYVLF